MFQKCYRTLQNFYRIEKRYGGDGVLLTNYKKPLIEAFQRYTVIFLPVSLPVYDTCKNF